jgi:hypothetical protein
LKLLGAITLLTALSVTSWTAPGPSAAPPSSISPAEIIDRYVKAVQAEQARPQPVSMEVEMDAKIPKLKKQGKFHAFRFITRVGQIFYQKPQFQGDSTVKKEVIARYLQAEKEARSDPAGSLAVTPDNYKFKYKGTTAYNDRTAYVFQVNPKKKKLGLYKGELWIDGDTYLPLREWGVLAKSPSVFIKDVYFVRDYTIYNGISIPRRLISDVNTRIAGKAQLTIWYENVKVGDGDAASAPISNGAAGDGSIVKSTASTAQTDGGTH